MRRLLIAFAVVFLATSPVAFARPKVAVAPLAGDSNDQVGEALREALGEKLAVASVKEVEKALDRLGISGALDAKDAQQLLSKLGAAVVVHGKLGKAGGRRSLKLVVAVKGKAPSDFSVQFKTATSSAFKTSVRDAILKRIGSLDELEEEDRPKKRVAERGEDERPKKRLGGGGGGGDDEDRPKKRSRGGDDDDDEARPKKRSKDGGERRPKKRVAEPDEGDDDEDRSTKRARKRRGGDDDEGDGEGVAERPRRALAAARVDAGLLVGMRRLTYSVASGQGPPTVATGGGAARVELELYPLAFSNPRGPAAGLGFTADFDKTLGLAIDVPGTGVAAGINQTNFSVGARYRILAGSTAVALGVRYARRKYIADRSALATPTALDAPDVDYAAVAPGATASFALGPKLAMFVGLDALLVLSTGAIQDPMNYGAAKVFGVDAIAGVDIALSRQLALRIAGDYTQINLSFTGTGAMAGARGVSAATDRTMGVAATLAALF